MTPISDMRVERKLKAWSRHNFLLSAFALAQFLAPHIVHAQGNNFDAADQRLMDAEQALLHSFTARVTAGESQPLSARVASKVVAAPVAKAATPEEAAVKSLIPTKPQDSSTTTALLTKKIAAAPIENDADSSNPEVLKNINANLRRELMAAQSKITRLERELDSTKSQVALAETEVNRLSSRLDSRTRASLGKYQLPSLPSAKPAQVHAAVQPQRSYEPPARTVTEVKPPSSNSDLHVATVSVDKADLRLGPGKNHSALMAVPRGSRLVVETRQGEWYRVFAPSGERAWIHGGMVLFGDGASVLNDGTAARVKGFNPNDEDEAFRRLNRAAAGQ